ncbi:hypothetical protein BDZ85DRAFT_68305 [Elsinoe ampelina]|uniref:Uncharacterized protein n=1 Tax=Elsinoe ampelina TaxID=302913 RepID=A0A6A6GIT8_9PEZI|nr:hypothetical protein BDZ85DRAFT_68305 [Elsinoe ampelina]
MMHDHLIKISEPRLYSSLIVGGGRACSPSLLGQEWSGLGGGVIDDSSTGVTDGDRSLLLTCSILQHHYADLEPRFGSTFQKTTRSIIMHVLPSENCTNLVFVRERALVSLDPRFAAPTAALSHVQTLLGYKACMRENLCTNPGAPSHMVPDWRVWTGRRSRNRSAREHCHST